MTRQILQKWGINVANENDKIMKLRSKKIQSFIMLAVLFVPVSFVLFRAGDYFSNQRELTQEALDTDVLSNIVSHMDNMSLTGLAQFDSNLYSHMQLMTSFLKEDVKDGEYTGERLLSDGFVATLGPDGSDDVILPDGAPSGDMTISRSLIEDSIASSALRTGQLTVTNNIDVSVQSVKVSDSKIYTLPESEVEEYTASDFLAEAKDVSMFLEDGEYFLSFAPVTDTEIYVKITPLTEFISYMQLYTSDILSALNNVAGISNGMIILLSETDGNLKVADSYGTIYGLEEIPESVLTSEILGTKKTGTVTVNGQSCRYICIKADATSIDAQQLYIIQFLPEKVVNSQMFLQSLLVCLLMLLIYITLIVYALSEQRYVLENVMTKEEAKRYNPSRLRRKLIYGGLSGAVAIVIIALLTQTVGQMHQQTRYGEYTLRLISGSIQESVEGQRSDIKSSQENWYVESCSLISSFLADKPKLATKEKLAEWSDILHSDYLMVFDSKGKEFASSNDYVDFSLNSGFGTNSSDFNSLLKGIPSVVHDVATDSVTKQERQYIGVTTTAVDDPQKHGALIISLMPGQTDVAGVIVDVGDEMALSLTNNTICFNANESTGEIINSSDPSMEGLSIEECGLSSDSLQGGYMDFGTVNGTNRFIITLKSGHSIFYYATRYDMLISENLIFSVVCILLYLVILVIIIHGVLKHYNDTVYKKLAVILLPRIPVRWRNRNADDPDFSDSRDDSRDNDSILPSRIRSKAVYLNQKIVSSRNGLLELINKIFKWDERLPEEKANLVFYAGVSIFLLFWFCMALSNEEDAALINYLLYGDWNKGFNTFSAYCILLTVAMANLFITLTSWILHLLGGFLSSRGETICKLLRSIIKYITIIVVVLLSMSYIGWLNSTVVASMGLGSLVLSLGAKDIVADILSGILIVFEETLRIGDIVRYDNNTGIVQEVGMRTTKLELIPNNDILEVRNHEIASVINMSKYASTCMMTLTIRASEPLEKVESLLTDKLHSIGEGYDAIIGRPVYLGVSKLGNNGSSAFPMLTLTIGFSCDQKDYFSAYNYLNRELHMLFDRNGIGVY